jgi:hypothetical protein
VPEPFTMSEAHPVSDVGRGVPRPQRRATRRRQLLLAALTPLLVLLLKIK